MTADNRYAWQDEVFYLWSASDFRGILKAVTGSGKSYAAVKCMLNYRQVFPKNTIWVLCDYNELKNQWRELLDKSGLKDVPVYLYMDGRNRLKTFRPDCMILDEVQHLEAEVWGQVADFGIPHMLGLSATPNTSSAKVGRIIRTVGFDEAYIASSTTHLVTFDMTDAECKEYISRCNKLTEYHEAHPNSNYYNDFNYMRIVNKRRMIVHSFPKRWKIGMDIVKKNFGRRMMIFFSTLKEINSFAEMLDREGVEYAIQTSKIRQIDQFKKGKKDILLSIKMVASGFSDPSVEVGIMLSYPSSSIDVIQKVGRILRPNGDKHADIYYVIAKGTMEEEIISKRGQLFPPNSTRIEEA